MLHINENEILASDGIHGKIGSVGVGFGTGRHTEGRRIYDKCQFKEDKQAQARISQQLKARLATANDSARGKRLSIASKQI